MHSTCLVALGVEAKHPMVEIPEHTRGTEPPPDIEALMKEVRARVEEKRRLGVYPPFEDEEIASAPAGRIQLLQAAAVLDPEGEPIRSHRPVLGWFIKSAKRLSRFWVRKYTDPIVLRQSMFNQQLLTYILEMRTEIEELRRHIDELEHKR